MIIAVDKNIPFIREGLEDLGELLLIDTPDFTPDSIQTADALIVRSETRVDSALLDRTNIRFVGSSTIGTDHIDLRYLSRQGIGFQNAPGCNADSVKEYVVSALLELAYRSHLRLNELTLGIVGFGNIGSRVAQAAALLGMRVLINDPPLERQRSDIPFIQFSDLQAADIITFHVPLIKDGLNPTYHLIDESRLKNFKDGVILVNTSRGSVVDNEALLSAIKSGKVSQAVLDVWEGEPKISVELLQRSVIGTPHIAGYSLDGRLNAVRMMRNAILRFQGSDAGSDDSLNVPNPNPVIYADRHLEGEGSAVRSILRECYDILEDDSMLREIFHKDDAERVRMFRQYRKSYRIRREFHRFRIEGADRLSADVRTILRGLRFQF